MPKIPEGAKVPDDHKTKTEALPERFTFEHDGETYEFDPLSKHLTPGFVRQHRSSEADFQYTLLELVAPADALVLLDKDWSLSKRVMRRFREHVEEYMREVMAD